MLLITARLVRRWAIISGIILFDESTTVTNFHHSAPEGVSWVVTFHLWPKSKSKSQSLTAPLDSSLNTCLVVHKFHLLMIIFIESFLAKCHIIVPAWLCGPADGCVCVCVCSVQCVCYQGAALRPPAIWPVSHL